MGNPYFDNSDPGQRFQPGTVADGNAVDEKFDRIATGLDETFKDTTRSLKFPYEEGMPSQEFVASSLQRRNRVLGFDDSGNIALVSGFYYRQAWQPDTRYFLNDVVMDPSTTNLYVAINQHVSGSEPDFDNTNRWYLAIDADTVRRAASDAVAAKEDAEASRDASRDARDLSEQYRNQARQARDESQSARDESVTASETAEEEADRAAIHAASVDADQIVHRPGTGLPNEAGSMVSRNAGEGDNEHRNNQQNDSRFPQMANIGWGSVDLPSVTDANDAMDSGVYSAIGTENMPFTQFGILVHMARGTNISQLAMRQSPTSDLLYVRSGQMGALGEWQEVQHSGNLPASLTQLLGSEAFEFAQHQVFSVQNGATISMSAAGWATDGAISAQTGRFAIYVDREGGFSNGFGVRSHVDGGGGLWLLTIDHDGNLDLPQSGFSANGPSTIYNSTGTPTLQLENSGAHAALRLRRLTSGGSGGVLTIQNEEGNQTASIHQDGQFRGRLRAGDIDTGTLDAARLPNHSANLLTSGTLPAARLPNHSAALLTSGTLNSNRIPTAHRMTTGNVLSAISSASAGAVGTYAFAESVGGTMHGFGTTMGGSSLRPGAVGSSGEYSSGALAGTWRCLGSIGSASGNPRFTLWLRI